jgi:hypothetical protein
MKNLIYMLIIIVTLMVVWLFLTVFIAFFGEMDYVTALRHPIQVFFAMFIYWWPPILVLDDYDNMMKSNTGVSR